MMLLTGFPAGFVRSPDRATLRSLFVIIQNRKTSPIAGMGSPFRVCATATLPVPHQARNYTSSDTTLLSVSYSGLSAGTQRIARNVSNVAGDSGSLQNGNPRNPNLGKNQAFPPV